MNLSEDYDRANAVTALDKIIHDRKNEQDISSRPDVQYFGNLNASQRNTGEYINLTDARQLDNTIIHEGARQNGGRRIWKIGAISSSGTVEHEMTFRIHGVLSKINLVPGEISHLNAHKAAALTQRIEIVGLGSAAFDDMIMNTKIVTDAFRRFLGSQYLPEWNIGEGYGDIRLNCSCLYLTKINGHTRDEVPFGPGVDPFGKFAKYKSQGYAHTSANIVRYFKRGMGNDKDVLYECFPANFRAGDIVEVQGNIIAFPTKDNAIKVVFQMNALTLEDASFSRAAELVKARKHAPPPAYLELKRKNWYEEDDEEMDIGRTRRKFKDLRLGDRAGPVEKEQE
ncbi:hypothetical protein R3P38DRAFT_3186856 [Favolaschia claudopus]|uniref:Uncharacterized protein n=1 Tax=Favolaschia claudopus TaxID=2862362 RepID=A0AAW0C2K0_9AGAR